MQSHKCGRVKALRVIFPLSPELGLTKKGKYFGDSLLFCNFALEYDEYEQD